MSEGRALEALILGHFLDSPFSHVAIELNHRFAVVRFHQIKEES
jgi:hypothetical protein